MLFRSLLLVACSACAFPLQAAEEPRKLAEGPLADYVAQDDPSYAVAVRGGGRLGTTEYADLILTSQTWRGDAWKHQLYLFKPATLGEGVEHGLLYIGGGNWNKGYEEKGELAWNDARQFAQLAEILGTCVVVVRQVPHQPILGGLREDEIISLTFLEFMEGKCEAEGVALLPMVKSAVRAMDAADSHARAAWNLPLKTFTVTGASKRGWTTYLTAAVDGRVTAAAPIVIDLLDIIPQMKHQIASWGKPSEAIHDYTEKGLMEKLDTPRGRELQGIVDPYSYRASLTLPKLVILATNDRYWPIDASNVYWEGLPGQKNLLLVPNNGHSIDDYGRVIAGTAGLHRQVLGGAPMPQPKWSYVGKGNPSFTLTMEPGEKVKRVSVWVARGETRDLRDSRWVETPLTAGSDGRYAFTLEQPEEGYAAFFGELMYEGENGAPVYVSTTVRVLGDRPAP